MTNLDIQKQRRYFANKGLSSQGYGFSVVMYGCESWTVKKAECRRIDAFELWCWRRLLRVPWTVRRSNQSLLDLKEISPGCSLEGMMLKLKLQYFGHLMRRVDSLEKTLMLGGIGGRKRKGWQRMRWLDGSLIDGCESEWTPGVGDGQRGLVCFGPWSHKESDMTERLNWTDDCSYCQSWFKDRVFSHAKTYEGNLSWGSSSDHSWCAWTQLGLPSCPLQRRPSSTERGHNQCFQINKDIPIHPNYFARLPWRRNVRLCLVGCL